ncbi:hypothetical protein FJZ53_05390 [Candidatus Woesearchaeota archaeon]|nr:hypothetical protein [Candidatus Woesearchaeota archaeon]
MRRCQCKRFSGIATAYEPARLGPIEGLRVRYTATIMSNEIEITQIDAIKEGIIYKMGYRCKKGSCKYSDVFEEMAKSVEPKTPEPKPV